MQKTILLCLIVMLPFIVFADMPGNKPRPSSVLHLKNIDSLKPYTLLIGNYGNSFLQITADTDYTIQGGYGASRPTILFAVNKDKNTDTLYLNADDEGRSIEITFNGIAEDRLIYSRTIAANNETADSSSNTVAGNISGKGTGLSNNNKWLIGISLAALAALVTWFIIKKNKAQKNAGIIKPGHGNV